MFGVGIFSEHSESDPSAATWSLTLCLFLCARWGLSPHTAGGALAYLSNVIKTVCLGYFMSWCYSCILFFIGCTVQLCRLVLK